MNTISNDDRGWLLYPFNNPLNHPHLTLISQVHLASIKPGATRGNHYHKHLSEELYIFGGNILVALHDTNANEEIHQEEVDCLLIPHHLQLKPLVAHAVKNIGNTIVYIFSFSPNGDYTEGSDFVRQIILS